MSKRHLRTVAILAMCALVMSVFAIGPAEAGKKKKKKKPAACAPYQPGELGAEAETTVVTDAATEEKPVELALATGPGLGFSGDNPPPTVSRQFTNVQVDSSAKDVGLFVRVEFLEAWDYDLFLRLADGTQLANSAGFGPVDDGSPEDSKHEFGAETIMGFLAADCAGYTVEVASATTPGGEVTLKYWLGEPN